MVTLTQKTLDFNHKIKLSNDGGSLSSDTGEFLFREFDEKIGFSKTLVKYLRLNDSRKYYLHSNENLLRQKVYQIIAGYAEDDAADQLTHDPVFKEIIETPTLASQPSLSRFYTRFDKDSIEQLNLANQEMLDKIHCFRQSKELFID
ncbi:transposase, partial [Heyndrickxia coagulans]